MIGHRLERTSNTSQARTGVAGGLRVTGLTGGPINDFELTVRPGEVVGVAGITGSGRELLAQFVTGQTPSDSGNV